MKLKSLLILFYCVFAINCASNAKMAIVSFDEQIELSDIIVYCKAVEVKKKVFGEDYAIVEIIQTIKGKIEEHRIKVNYGESFFKVKNQRDRFARNRTYVLFLVSEKNKFQILGGFQGYYAVTDDNQICESKGEKIGINDFIGKIRAHQ